nr:unnamed protein product [Callosobruchus chinensis]
MLAKPSKTSVILVTLGT